MARRLPGDHQLYRGVHLGTFRSNRPPGFGEKSAQTRQFFRRGVPGEGSTGRRTLHGPSRVRLPLRFDASRLGADLQQIAPSEWVPHFNSAEHNGGWSGLALLDSNGDETRLYPQDEAGSGRSTKVLERCAYLRETLDRFQCPILAARLLRLSPGGRIYEHRDYGLGFDAGRIRIHIPIQTGGGVRFVVGGRRVSMTPGEVWYLDFELPHQVDNDGQADRVHLVLDCAYNEWLRDCLEAGDESIDVAEDGPPLSAAASPLDAFRRRLLADPTLCTALQDCREPQAFGALASELAQQLGFEVSIGEVEAAVRAATRGGSGLPVAGALSLDGWIPTQVEWRGEREVEWCWLGRRRLLEPFFSDSILRARHQPFSRFLRPVSSLEALERLPFDRPGLPLMGWIAHVSRCGSTLVARMLSSLSSLVVLSEPSPLDVLLTEARPGMSHLRRVGLIRAMMRALGQAREGSETGVILKLDSWHLQSLSLLREAFPEVPGVILYRDPVEVLVSQMRQPGMQMVPGMTGALFDRVPIEGLSPIEYRARIMGGLFDAAMNEGRRTMVVSYAELPDATRTRLVPHFRLEPTSGDVSRMLEIQGLDAKNPGLEFAADSAHKQQEATPELRRLAEKWAGAAFRSLEALRSEQLHGNHHP
jgi:hypothetical protein